MSQEKESWGQVRKPGKELSKETRPEIPSEEEVLLDPVSVLDDMLQSMTLADKWLMAGAIDADIASHVNLPYIMALSERIARIEKKLGLGVPEEDKLPWEME